MRLFVAAEAFGVPYTEAFGAPLTAEEKRLQARRNRDVKRNVFGEPVGAGLRKGGRLDRAVQQLHS